MKPMGWLLNLASFWVLVYTRMISSASFGMFTASLGGERAVSRSKCWRCGADVAIAGGGRVRGGIGEGEGASKGGKMGNVWFGVRLGFG